MSSYDALGNPAADQLLTGSEMDSGETFHGRSCCCWSSVPPLDAFENVIGSFLRQVSP